MATTNYNLPTITGNMTADVVRDMNALAEATDSAIKQAVDGVDLTNITQQITDVDARVTTHLGDYVKHPGYAVDSGTANAKVVALNPAPTAYVDGMAISFKNVVQNTGATTININGLGAKAVVKSDGNALSSGILKVGSIYTLRYNATTSNFILQGEGGGVQASGNTSVSFIESFSNSPIRGFNFTGDGGRVEYALEGSTFSPSIRKYTYNSSGILIENVVLSILQRNISSFPDGSYVYAKGSYIYTLQLSGNQIIHKYNTNGVFIESFSYYGTSNITDVSNDLSITIDNTSIRIFNKSATVLLSATGPANGGNFSGKFISNELAVVSNAGSVYFLYLKNGSWLSRIFDSSSNSSIKLSTILSAYAWREN